MTARDSINDNLPWLEYEIRSEAKGVKHFLAGFEDAMEGMTQSIEEYRHE